MRIAYFVMAHHMPSQLEWLVQALADRQDLLLLHIDAKSVLGLRAGGMEVWRTARRLVAERPNVHLLRPRFTNWGGWSMARLHLRAMDVALDLCPHWTHFVNLSGQCYPIRPIAELRTALAAAGGTAFVEMRPLASLPEEDWHHRWRPMLETPLKAFVLPGRRRPPCRFRLDHKGSQWSMLPRAFCEWQRGSEVRRSIAHYMSHLHLTDELIIQALVRNGPWRERVAAHYGREILWPGHIVTSADLPRLLASPGFFTRKVDFAADPELGRALAARGGFPMPIQHLRPPARGGPA